MMIQRFCRFLLIPIVLLLVVACNPPLGGTATTVTPAVNTAVPAATEPEMEAESSPTTAAAAPTEATTEEAEPTPADTEAEATEAPAETPEAEAEATATPEPAPTAAPEQAVGGDPTQVTLSLQSWLSGFDEPVGIAHAGDGTGRLFVVEKGGTVRVIQDEQILPDPLLDISSLVSNGSEQGLLGMAFEPNRPDRFYVNYTNRVGDTEIVRYRTLADNPNVADPNSAELLLEIQQPAQNHNGGNLVFGPDGFLWIGTGDGGAADDRFQTGQDYSALLGSMLRIDVSGESDYTIPADNPYAGGDGGSPAVWAKGLRNPWRYSFDRLTGDLWIADVGQNQYEEVNRTSSSAANLNYGWPLMEATHCYLASDCTGLEVVMPVTEYDHNFGCSITGGYVYRGAQYPALQGIYIFSDYCTGNYWGLSADTESFAEPTQLLQSPVRPFVIGEDEAGELYVGGTDGVLYQVVAE